MPDIYHGMMLLMEKDFEPLKTRLREINKLLDLDEQAYFGPLVEKFSGDTSEFQRIMRDLGSLVLGFLLDQNSKFTVKFNIFFTMRLQKNSQSSLWLT